MRRFSQRSALVTLSEINITPLLDLAFVLLVIFIITTPLLEHRLPLFHVLARNYQNPADRPAYLADDRRGLECVVRHCTCESQCPLQRGWLNFHHLHVRHLVWRNSKELRGRRL